MRRAASLLLALGFALLATAARAADGSLVIYPRGTNAATGPAAVAAGGGVGAMTIFGALLLAGVGAWLLWRGRRLPFAARIARRLELDETRSLGSRQYLVVASYEGQKYLLGVCPGRIDLLTPLNATPGREKSP